MNRLQEGYCLNDEVYYSAHISAVFTIDGEQVYLVKSYDDYLTLKRHVTVTHRIGSIEPCGDLHKCEMIGSDGSKIVFYLGYDDIHHNMQYTESQMSIQHIPAICSFLCSLFFIEMLF